MCRRGQLSRAWSRVARGNTAVFLLILAADCCILLDTYLTFPPTGGVSAMMRNLMTLLLVLLGSSVAFAQAAEKLLPADGPIEHGIDHYIDVKLKEAKINPAPLADDAAILRRLTLDLN